MIPYLLHIPSETPNQKVLLWTFKTAVKALNLRHVHVKELADQQFENILLSRENIHSILAEPDFIIQDLAKTKFEFNERGVILINGKEDLLLTSFYLINSLSEYNSKELDAIGRYPFEQSYQKQYSCITKNVVAELYAEYFKIHLPHPFRNALNEKSSFFFSHDIDSLYGAILQDGLAALKKGRFDIITRLVLNTIFLKPDWFNIDQILKIDSEYDLRSTFFWIVNKGRVSKTLTNADYNIGSVSVKKAITQVKDKGCHVGLHKSISPQNFDQELSMLPVKSVLNRNHYLRFNLPEHYQAVQNSSVKIDCSLGFAEHYGFRNSLAIPFVPFDIAGNQPFRFLEVPLNVMDGTFQKYMQISPEKVSEKIISFIEDNKVNSVLSVLWHNHFFSSFRFKGYFEPYVELLEYLKQNKFSAIAPDQIYNKYFFE